MTTIANVISQDQAKRLALTGKYDIVIWVEEPKPDSYQDIVVFSLWENPITDDFFVVFPAFRLDFDEADLRICAAKVSSRDGWDFESVVKKLGGDPAKIVHIKDVN